MGKLQDLIGKFFKKQAASAEDPEIAGLRQEIISATGCSRLIEMKHSGGEVSFNEIPISPGNISCSTLISLTPERFLPNPEYLLAQAVEKQVDSLVVLARDPVACNTPEPQHPEGPSFSISSWQHTLEKSEYLFHLQFIPPNSALITGRKKSPLVLPRGEVFDEQIEVHSSMEKPPVCRYHSGWAAAENHIRIDGMGVLYVLNRSTEPVSLDISTVLDVPEKGKLRIHKNFSYLEEIVLEEGSDIDINFQSIVLPPGGHGLQLVSTDATEFFFKKISIQANRYSREQFQMSLSFDQYQRHRGVSDIITGVFEPEVEYRVLDVGGGGSLLSMFISDAEVTTLDPRQYDRRNHVQNQGDVLPFEDDAFDAVVSVDTLEHVPEHQREAFLDELLRVSRRWIVLACPFQHEKTDAAERLFATFESQVRGIDNAFLNEHLENGLPDLASTMNYLQRSLPSLNRLPNGWLPRWFTMMVFQSTMATCLDHFSLGQKIISLYNKDYYRFDNSEPAYRQILIGSKNRQDDTSSLIDRLTVREPAGNRSFEDPREILNFYDIPVSESFNRWYDNNQIKDRAQELH